MNNQNSNEITSSPKFTTSPTLFDGSQEVWASYGRADGLQMIMSVLSPGKNDFGAFFIGEGIQEANVGTIEAREIITLSIAETRILRDLLNRPEVQTLLGA